MQRHHDVLIVGTGPAGTQVALGLKEAGFGGSITLMSFEAELPYDRPPLSKAYLTGDLTDEALLTRPRTYWPDRGIELILGTEVATVEPTEHQVVTADGRQLTYRSLVWAAGCRARTLPVPGQRLGGVLSLRTWSDAQALRPRLTEGQRLVVVGGGYIGLEVAAAATKAGAEVTVIEAQDRLLARVAGTTVADFVASRHASEGVRVLTGQTVEELTGTDDVTGVRLGSGVTVPADTVVVGVGVVPNIEPLVAAGADATDGLTVDGLCRTSLPDVFAAGDCARHEDVTSPTRGARIESIPNATAHARAVVAGIVGSDVPDHPTPWFWSNQYDLRLKTAGLLAGYDRTVVRGDPETGRFAVVYISDDTVVAVDSVNSPKDFAQGKALIGACVPVDDTSLSDTSLSLVQTPSVALRTRDTHSGGFL